MSSSIYYRGGDGDGGEEDEDSGGEDDDDDDLDEDINAHDGGSRADMTRGLAKFLSISNENHFS